MVTITKRDPHPVWALLTLFVLIGLAIAFRMWLDTGSPEPKFKDSDASFRALAKTLMYTAAINATMDMTEAQAPVRVHPGLTQAEWAWCFQYFKKTGERRVHLSVVRRFMLAEKDSEFGPSVHLRDPMPAEGQR